MATQTYGGDRTVGPRQVSIMAQLYDTSCGSSTQKLFLPQIAAHQGVSITGCRVALACLRRRGLVREWYMAGGNRWALTAKGVEAMAKLAATSIGGGVGIVLTGYPSK